LAIDFGNYNYSLRKTVGKKMTKMALLCTFSVFVLLKF